MALAGWLNGRLGRLRVICTEVPANVHGFVLADHQAGDRPNHDAPGQRKCVLLSDAGKHMRMGWELGFALLFLAACSDDCPQTLGNEFSSCEQIEQDVASRCGSGEVWAESGTCQSLRFVQVRELLRTSTWYCDASGKVVAMHLVGDTSPSSCNDYGQQVDCNSDRLSADVTLCAP